MLAGLSDDRSSLAVTDMTYLEWVHRVDPLVTILRDAGLWELPKPWLSLFVPADRADEFLTQVSAQLDPAELGAGLATVVPFRSDTLRRPLFEVPRSPRAFQLTLLRFPFPAADIDGTTPTTCSPPGRASSRSSPGGANVQLVSCVLARMRP